MFRAATGPSSGDKLCLCDNCSNSFVPPCIPDGHSYRKQVPSVSSDDGTKAARNMYRLTNRNIVRKKLCNKLVYLQDHLLIYKQENNF